MAAIRVPALTDVSAGCHLGFYQRGYFFSPAKVGDG